MNDIVKSDNGDVLKVLSTVTQIVRDITNRFPDAKIIFTGSIDERTKLYVPIATSRPQVQKF